VLGWNLYAASSLLPPRLRASTLALILFGSPVLASQLPPSSRLSEINLPDGAYHHVPPHSTLIVDTVSNDLGGLFVQGELIFDPLVTTTELRSAWILVGTSDPQKPCKIQIGSALAPWPSTATAKITLLGMFDLGGGVTAKDPADPDGDPQTASPSSLLTSTPTILEALLRDGGLVIYEEGRLYAFGAEYGVPWTELEAKANANDTSLTVAATIADVAQWAGKEIVLASSDFDPGQAEVFSVQSVSTSGPTVVTLQPPGACVFDHYALDYQPSSTTGSEWMIRERAEVGLLTRNVTIHAERYAGGWIPATGEHGHVFLGRDIGATTPVARVSWVEFRNLGVLGKKLRYPLHYHETGDQSAQPYPSFVRDCVFRACFNKFLSVHATQNMEVTGNVGLGTVGNGFFLEDRDAQGILLENNLGLGVVPVTEAQRGVHAPSEQVGDEDLEPGVFWFVSPLNKIAGNRAAGSSHYGFWYSPVNGEDALVTPPDSYFTNNVAHSNGHHGFYQDKVATAIADRAAPWYDPPNERPQWWDCQAWKNRRYGFWVRSYGNLFFDKLKAADNRGAYYFASAGFQDVVPGPNSFWRTLSQIALKNSLAIGETDNSGYVTLDGMHWHEVYAQRSLPQPVVHKDGGRPHELAWATLVGVEIYDGLILLDTVRFGDFEDLPNLPYPDNSDSETRRSAGISQVVYDSQYMADPRNRAENSQFANVAHRVGFRYPGALASGANMIKNTIVFDEDGSLTSPSLGVGYLMPSAEPFLADGVTSTVLPSHGVRHVPVANEDYASLVIDTPNASPMPYWVLVTHSYPAVGASMKVREGAGEERFPLSVLMDREYAIEYLQSNNQPFAQADRPQVVDLVLRFAEQEDEPVIVAVPWFTTTEPTTPTVNDDDMTEMGSLADLRSPLNAEQSFYWDAATQTIYLKLISDLRTPTLGLLLSGTEQHCKIRQ